MLSTNSLLELLIIH